MKHTVTEEALLARIRELREEIVATRDVLRRLDLVQEQIDLRDLLARTYRRPAVRAGTSR